MATAKTTKYGYKPTHPGEVLKDEIAYRNISQVKLAGHMGISYKILNVGSKRLKSLLKMFIRRLLLYKVPVVHR